MLRCLRVATYACQSPPTMKPPQGSSRPVIRGTFSGGRPKRTLRCGRSCWQNTYNLECCKAYVTMCGRCVRQSCAGILPELAVHGCMCQVVDYPGLAADGRFQQVLAQVASLPPVSLTKNETYALFINGTPNAVPFFCDGGYSTLSTMGIGSLQSLCHRHVHQASLPPEPHEVRPV